MTAAPFFHGRCRCGAIVYGPEPVPAGALCGDCKLGLTGWPPDALPDDVELSEVAGCYGEREVWDEENWAWDARVESDRARLEDERNR